MFKRLTLLMLASLVLVGTAPQVKANPHSFTLHNRTGVDIHRLFVAHHSQADWDEHEDLLNGAVMQAGGEVQINLNKTAPSWDLRVESQDGSSLNWDDVNLSDASDVVLEANGVARVK